MEDGSERVFKDERFGKSRFLMYRYGQGFMKEPEFRSSFGQSLAQQAWDLIEDRIRNARRMFIEGKASPILYYMEKNLLNPKDLSIHAGIPLFRVKRHFKPKVFNKLPDRILEKYAEVFGITRDQLKNID